MNPCLRALASEWSALLAASVAGILGESLVNEKDSPAATAISQGLQMLSEYGKDGVGRMLKSYQTIIFEVSRDPEFPLLFAELFKFTAALFSNATRKRTKVRSLHTDQIVKGEELSEVASLSCEILEFLARALDRGTRPTSIDSDTMCAIFAFLEQDQPNRVRAAAGGIVGSLSTSASVCDDMCKIMWARFGRLKKDSDFRNFAAWVDGVVGLQVTLDDPAMAKVALSFLQKFCDNGKKIERGVLRMKFLDAIGEMVTRLNGSATAGQNPEYSRVLNEMWAMVDKWAKREKHAEFCLKFLLVMLATGSASFFVTGHGKAFCEQLMKYTKGGSCELGILKLVAEFVRVIPAEVVKNDFAEFEKTVKLWVLPIFLSDSEDGKKRLKFSAPEQIEVATRMLAEVGLKHMPFFIEVGNAVFVDPNQKVLRLVCLQALNKIAASNEEALRKHSSDVVKWLEPVWLKQVVNGPQEFDQAAFLFPVVELEDPDTEASIAQVLFDEAKSTHAHASLCKFIEKKVNMKQHAILPIGFMLTLLDKIGGSSIDVILKNMALLLGITDSFKRALARCEDACSLIMDSKSMLTYVDWCNFRKAVDTECLPLLLWPCDDVRRFVSDFLLMFSDGTYRDLDKTCLPADKFTLTDWCNVMPKDTDVFENIPLLLEASPAAGKFNFEIMCDFINAGHELEPAFLQRIFVFLGATATSDSEKLEQYFETLFQSMDRISVGACLDSLNHSLWDHLLISLEKWIGEKQVDYAKIWKHIVAIYYSLSIREEFPVDVQNEMLQKFFKRFCRKVWKDCDSVEQTMPVFEKSLRVATIVIQNTDAKQIVEQDEVDSFAVCSVRMCSLFESDTSRWSFCDAVLTFLNAVLETLEVSETTYTHIEAAIISVSQLFEQNSRINNLACRVLTNLLLKNPGLISRVYLLTYSEMPRISSAALLAFANALSMREDFHAVYDKGAAYAMAAILANISETEIIVRRAAFKIMCILMSQTSVVCEKEASRSVVTSITSSDAIGFLGQGMSFVKFASQNLKSQIVSDMFGVFASSISMRAHQAPLVEYLIEFVPLMMKTSTIDLCARAMARISAECKCDDTATALQVKTLWLTFCRLLKQQYPDQQTQLLQQVFQFVESSENLSTNGTLAIALVLTHIFEVFPNETASVLLQYVLKPYDFEIPDDTAQYCAFWNSAKVSLAPTKSDIVALNALSQILLMVNQKSVFQTLFGGKLDVLLLAALMTLSAEQYHIEGIYPLLDSLLDASLLRFAGDPETASSNLELLQSKGLVSRATSLKQQATLWSEQARNIVAYDHDLVRCLTDMFAQTDATFKGRFFGKLVAFAFQIEPQNPRSLEPFMMIMAMGAQMSTEFMYRILLFTLYVFRTNRSELMDCLIDCVKFHLLALSPESQQFTDETMPVLIILLLYLSLDLRTSLAAHIMKIIGQILTTVRDSPAKDKVQPALVEYLGTFGGCKYVALQFLRFIKSASTFGDDNVKAMIQTLDILAGLFPEQDNWCSMLALLIDGARRFIGERGQRPIDNVLPQHTFQTVREFTDALKSHTQNESLRDFMFVFFCNIITSFKSCDFNRDSAVLCILASLCESDYNIPGDDAIKFLMLVSISADEYSQRFCAPLLATSITTLPPVPQFIDVKERPYNNSLNHSRTIVDPACLPSFPLPINETSSDHVVDSIWSFISEKIGGGEICFVAPTNV